MHRRAWPTAAVLLALFAACCAQTAASPSAGSPGWGEVTVGGGTGPVMLSAPWDAPMPAVRRAVVVVHGLGRDVEGYFQAGVQARESAGPAHRDDLIVAPYFATEAGRRDKGLVGTTLVWPRANWEDAGRSEGPDRVSSYAVIDAIMARLADRRLFPSLTEVVMVGHSGGAQLTQRYALIGQGEARLSASGVALKYVVANPSSYVWLDDDRPGPVTGCPRALEWKYGLHPLPDYAQQRDPRTLAEQFAKRDVTYLLGTLDVDPNHPVLDKTCMGEAQGPTRWARGHNFFAALQARFGTGWTSQRLFPVPGVAHQGGRMITSDCGVAVIFRDEACR